MNKYYDHLLYKEYQTSVTALGLYRILFAIGYLLLIGVPSCSWVVEAPEYFFFPQRFSIARPLFETIPPKIFLVILDLSIFTSLICLLFGYRTRWSSFLFGCLVILCYSIQFSLGKISHSILLNVLPIIMAFSAWGNSFSLDNKQSSFADRTDAYAPFLVAIVLGFAMFTAGWSKVLAGWLDPDRFGTYLFYSKNYYIMEDEGLLSSLFASISTPFLWKSMDYGAVALEVLFLPAVLNRKVLRFFCLFALIFHLFAWWVLNIAYMSNLLVYLLFIRWTSIVAFLKHKKILARIERFLSWKTFWIVFSVLFIQHIYFLFFNDELLVRDRLISPFSFFVTETLSFRAIRAVVMFTLAIFVIFFDFYTYYWYKNQKQEII